MGEDERLGMSAPKDFRTTHWSVVLAARFSPTELSVAALESLSRSYWMPVYAFIRRRGHPPADAQDLTQEFFARMIEKKWLDAADSEKGRFRTFLLTALTRFLANEHDRAQRLKRGGGMIVVALDATDAENRLIHEPVDTRTPEQQFDRLWAESLLERVLSRLEEEFDGTGRSGRFAVLQTYLLEDRGTLSYSDAAARLGMTESAVKAGVFRLRRRYGELVREEIANTVGDESEIEAELGHLLHVMS